MTPRPSTMPNLVGRATELEPLFELVDGLPEQGGALVVRGEPGIGKTSLLAAVSRHATDHGVQVLSTVGVQTEADLPFSGLHQLLLPLLGGNDWVPTPQSRARAAAPQVPRSFGDRLGRLPKSQQIALLSALGLRAELVRDRFLVGLAVLSLLSEEAEGRPILCVLDDAQWLDQISAQTLAFVARRVALESVAMVFAEREPSEPFHGLRELAVGALRDVEARELLRSIMRGPLDDRVRDRILAESRGNPLGLLELRRWIPPAESAGGFRVTAVAPPSQSVSRRIEESFLRRFEMLPDGTRLLLLIAAAEPLGDPVLLWRAADRLGIGSDSLVPAAAAGLVEVGDRVQFRHQLVRSGIYGTASLSARQEVHRALADATERDVDPDRWAWHRAVGAESPDEEVAAELERSAGRAKARGGLAAAAAFLERAVGLTLDPALRAPRALAAARAKFEAAAPETAFELLAIAEMSPLDDLQRGRLERLRAQIAFLSTGGTKGISGLAIGPQAPGLLLDAAKRLEPLDADLARETYLEALTTGMWVDCENGYRGVSEAAEAARTAPPGPLSPGPLDLLLDALAIRFTEPYAEALPSLGRALDALTGREAGADEDIRWLWFACPVTPEPLAPEVWDDERWHELATRAVRLAREAGSVAMLPNALTARAMVHVLAGELAAASALIEDAYAITEATGNAPLRFPSFLLAAWTGQEAAALAEIKAGIQDATARGLQRPIRFAHCATAVLYNGLSRYEDALAAAQFACAHEDLGICGWGLTELIEAAARSGAREVASEALHQLAERTSAAGTDWALGIEARSRALLSEGEVAERLYREAIERLARTRIRAELARARLHYGEWLRRERRRVDAREQLRQAHHAFVAMGAEAFAERARRELLATGEKVRKRLDETRDELTPQEERIARLARQGLTNPEIGAQLFISPRTVESHLRKVFTKLDISSRNELREAALPALSAEALVA